MADPVIVISSDQISPTPEQVGRWLRRLVRIGSQLQPGKVIPGNDRAPLPSGLCATVTRIGLGSPQQGEAMEWTMYADDGDEADRMIATLARETRSSYSCQWFRDGAAAAGERCRFWMRGQYSQLEADVLGGLTLTRIGHLYNTSDMFRSRIEERAAFDLHVRYVSTIRSVIPRAQSFEGAELIVDDVRYPLVSVDVHGGAYSREFGRGYDRIGVVQ